ncbi:MAG: SIR2 family protein [Clostridium perfringens]|nr:SIR2 family protein [Clostridium perfringens]
MNPNIEKLKEDYLNDKIVPFIGAGLSAPFKIPTWERLIKEITKTYAVDRNEFLIDAVNIQLENLDFWGAIDTLKKFANLDDYDIKEEIVNIIKREQIKPSNDYSHNYKDLADMNFKTYLTTNYDNLIYEYSNCENVPICLKDIDFNIQHLFDEQRIFHLHGMMSNCGTIVISKESYDELYKNKKYKNLLKAVTSNKKLLFLGFSFDDQFVKQLISDHKEFFKGEHYIILDNPPGSKIKELKSNYGLRTIEYDSSKIPHHKAIRQILNKIRDTDTGLDEENLLENQDIKSPIIGAKLDDLERDLEKNLFYQKLKIENIDNAFIDLSSIFYIAAETYIRELNKCGFSLDVINAMLAKVLMKYKEQYCEVYSQCKNSEEFIKAVHNSLKNIDWGRYSQFFNKGQLSSEEENRGLIHILADDKNKDVWWGDNRIE